LSATEPETGGVSQFSGHASGTWFMPEKPEPDARARASEDDDAEDNPESST
jgi:hypothetical protein